MEYTNIYNETKSIDIFDDRWYHVDMSYKGGLPESLIMTGKEVITIMASKFVQIISIAAE